MSAILEFFDGTIVGLKMDDKMTQRLCIESSDQTCKSHRTKEMIFHSDHGSQFTSSLFEEALKKHNNIALKITVSSKLIPIFIIIKISLAPHMTELPL